jgi:hypothetical protein
VNPATLFAQPAFAEPSFAQVGLLRPELCVAALELSRLSGVMAVAPIPWSNTPRKVKVGLIIFLLLAVHGLGDSKLTELPSAGWAAIHVSTEFLIGISIGMVVRLSVAAAEIAGGAIATPIGFSAAQAFDPSIGTTDSVVPRLFSPSSPACTGSCSRPSCRASITFRWARPSTSRPRFRYFSSSPGTC